MKQSVLRMSSWIYLVLLLNNDAELSVSVIKMPASPTIHGPDFLHADKHLIQEAERLDCVLKSMPQQGDVSAASWLCKAQQTSWLIQWVLTLWLMISVLVAHLSVRHNLPALADIDSLSLHWSGFFALALKKRFLFFLFSYLDIHVTAKEITKITSKVRRAAEEQFRWVIRTSLNLMCAHNIYVYKQTMQII